MTDAALTYDSKRFARWLKRYGESEKLVWKEVAAKAGISDGTMYSFVNGPPPHLLAAKKGKGDWDPTINVLSALAHALDLDLGFLLTKAGVDDSPERAARFTVSERELIYLSLGLARQHYPHALLERHRSIGDRLQTEIHRSLSTKESH